MSRHDRHTRRVRRAALYLAVGFVALACTSARAPREEPLAESPALAELVATAEQARAAGELDVAVERYREALARTPWNPRLESALAAVLVERADRDRREGGLRGLEQAERDLGEACALQPDDATLRRNLALLLAEHAARSPDPEVAEELRARAHELDADAEESVPETQPRLERRLDLAFELLERGQLDAGVLSLESIHRDYPDAPAATRLLAQALVRRGNELAERGDLVAAGEQLDRAVALYATPGLCRPGPCRDDEAALAHRNRISVWLHLPRLPQARRALEEAAAVGLEFPDLRSSLEAAERSP